MKDTYKYNSPLKKRFPEVVDDEIGPVDDGGSGPASGGPSNDGPDPVGPGPQVNTNPGFTSTVSFGDDDLGIPSGDPNATITENTYDPVTSTPVRGREGGVSPTVFSYDCRPVYLEEKHMTVIRKGPTTPVTLEMYNTTQPDYNNDGVVDVEGVMMGISYSQSLSGGVPYPSSPYLEDGTIDVNYNDRWPNGTNFSGVSKYFNTDGSLGQLERNISIFYDDAGYLLQAGDTVVLNINAIATGEDWALNDKLSISGAFYNNFNVKKGCGISGTITSMAAPVQGCSNCPDGIEIVITSISPSTPKLIGPNDVYTVLLQDKEPMFEYKFPRFGYRYKYEDGEYSVFSPWSEIAFIPEDFDYVPKKGYNLGMTNRVRSLEIVNFVPKNMPKDVVQIDLLYKESNSPNIYTVESFKKQDVPTNAGALYNYWNSPGTGGNKGRYRVTSELIHAVVPSNQLLRPWDNVPRMALGQEVTANRLIYANYLQNYSTIDAAGAPIKPIFSVETSALFEYSLIDLADLDDAKPYKSLKSMRTYQLGVVYRDRYGRETPVLTSESGSIKVEKESSFKTNRLSVALGDTGNGESNYPDWAESFTFYIKETSNEYYNLAMDRWYNADDGGVWLSFPSSERNKIMDDTTLLLKKYHDSNKPVLEDTKYKVISIKNNAPTFIKTENQYWGSLSMMLPPPGWGNGSKPGGWQSGMFSPSGLPLPNHQFLDIYAEYWDQSVFSDLIKQPTCQIRLVQAPGQASNYNPATGSSSKSSSTSFSKWYDVASIAHIGQPPEIVDEEVFTYDSNGNAISSVISQVELPATEIQLVRVTLEKVLGAEIGFAFSADLLDLSRGLSLEARTQIVKDKSQFEGRFFVKIERDAVIENSIIDPQTKFEENFQVLQSREVSYLCAAHPGKQDWNHEVYIPIAGEGSYPISFDTSNNSQTQAAYPLGASFDTAYPLGSMSAGDVPRMISSYHADSRSAPAVGNNGVLIQPPIPGSSNNIWQNSYDMASGQQVQGNGTKYVWPLGPGQQESEVYLDSTTSTSFSPVISGGGWLSDAYANALGYIGSARTISGTDGGRRFPSYAVGPSSNKFYAGGPWQPGYGLHSSRNEVYGWNKYDASLVPDGEDLIEPQPHDGGNNFWKPAIWDRGDGPHGGDAVKDWTQDSIYGLAGGWYDLYAGRKIWGSWPFKGSWRRWFIDKIGSAQGYSGAGIWDDGNVSKMDISFFGIGKSNKVGHRSHDMARYQQEELTFSVMLATVGTSFRFGQDPDGTIYTVTGVTTKNVYNFEAPCGTWGALDGTSKPMEMHDDDGDAATPDVETGEYAFTENGNYGPNDGSLALQNHEGSGCGRGMWPTWGPAHTHPDGIAGGVAFMSDFLLGIQSGPYNSIPYASGGSFLNRRTRHTLTLDKKIGSGPNGFHPITNHVGEKDATGAQQANILASTAEKEAPEYSVRTTVNGYGSATASNGATPDERYFYNLNSYWNADDRNGGAEDTQPDTVNYSDAGNFYSQNQEAYIGLHERGLNHTTIEIVAPYSGDETDRPMSNNPAIWETEPKEDVGLDIYQAASPSYPINLERHRNDVDPEKGWYDYLSRGEEYIPVGSRVMIQYCGPSGKPSGTYVDGVDGNIIYLNGPGCIGSGGTSLAVPQYLADGSTPNTGRVFWNGEGGFYGRFMDSQFANFTVKRLFSGNALAMEIEPVVHGERRSLNWFNCYSYGNGVESNRVRDDYNAVTIDKGVKASMPLAEQYEEERKPSSLIFSGIYNSTSGVNSTNQFIQAEPITKDLNPVNGSIQKLHTRDSDLVTFCENKVFKILAKKDALFNADGNSNVTSNAAVLGQAMPFSGEYGMSKNPESFASESFRIYFTDKTRGAVLRLSKDGLSNISDYGMKDWFKDRLKFAERLVGSFDDRKDEYNLTIETYETPEPEFVKLQTNTVYGDDKTLSGMSAYTVSYTESRKGWVSFKSFIQQGGFSYKNEYYTFPSNIFNRTDDIVLKSPLGFLYGDNVGNAEVWKHNQDIKMRALILVDESNSATIEIMLKDSLRSASDYTIVKDMVVSGNGIPLQTTIVDVAYSGPTTAVITISNTVHVFADEEIIITSSRNNFYDVPSFSSVTVMFNGEQGSVKRFKTINYEGSQAEVTLKQNNVYYLYDTNKAPKPSQGLAVGEIYYDNYPKDGWRVEELKTDMQEGLLSEFINKENKWFNYIRGFSDAGEGDRIDIGEFSAQGLGRYEEITEVETVQGCLDTTAINYAGQGNTNGFNPPAGLPCYGCCIYSEGCLDANAINFDPYAESSCDDCCLYKEGCTDSSAFNYDPTAHVDDGSCIYCVYGCTDPVSGDYSIDATCDDGTCTYNYGCTDSVTIDGAGVGVDGALNYDAAANQDDGSCVYCVYGCMQVGANNYNPLATCNGEPAGGIDQGMARFGDEYEDEGDDTPTNTNPYACDFCVHGCMDATATNYDVLATCDDGSCYNEGCTDASASNYDPNANADDGTCYNCEIGCTDTAAYDYDPAATCDCNGEAEYIGQELNPLYMTADGWDNCCQELIRGCTNTAAVNYLNTQQDGGRDCAQTDLPSGVYPNAPCLSKGIYTGNNVNDYGCDMPDITPNTYIKIIQDISGSMDHVTQPTIDAIIGGYGDANCLRTDLQDIYANHPNWRQSNCDANLGQFPGPAGCSTAGGNVNACDGYPACDAALNGADAYESHVTHVVAWEYPVGWAANVSPTHNHTKRVSAGVNESQTIGGFWGPNAIVGTYAGQASSANLVAGNAPYAADASGLTTLDRQKLMDPGLAGFPADAEKIYIITLGDEIQPHYTGSTTNPRYQNGGADYITGFPWTNGQAGVDMTIAEELASRPDALEQIEQGCNFLGFGADGASTVDGYQGFAYTFDDNGITKFINNPDGETIMDLTGYMYPHYPGCGNLAHHGPPAINSSGVSMGMGWTDGGVVQTAVHDGALLKDITTLRNNIIAMKANRPGIVYGSAWQVLATNNENMIMRRSAHLMHRTFDCVREGYCPAFGDFTGTSFSTQGFSDIRHVGDLVDQHTKFVVPDIVEVSPNTSNKQEAVYDGLVEAFNLLGVNI